MKEPHVCESKSDIYLPEPATVLQVKPMTRLETYFKFKLNSGKPLGHRPGQFVQVSLPGIGEAPISISSSPTRGASFDMVVRNVGNVSGAMHKLRSVDRVGIRGPFGTEFPVDEMKGKDVLLICGGIGLVPVRSVIQYILDNREDYGRIMILIGTKTSADRLFIEEIKEWRRVKNITLLETVDHRDENWSGIEGVITMLLPLVKVNPSETVAVVCGPPIMYKFVIVQLQKMKVPDAEIYVSLERHMKCGVGKCGHCQINQFYVCQEGPVFKFSDISDIEEAIE
ncbi:MAG: FAD/NAD(P)-binding protein [Sedimentisphaerales bacterium]|nr:FAD/NAD(P)-binding protein [Sedimentisphaerales bacterium]